MVLWTFQISRHLSQSCLANSKRLSGKTNGSLAKQGTRPRDRPSSIGLALHPYLLNTKDSGVFWSGVVFEIERVHLITSCNENVGLSQ